MNEHIGHSRHVLEHIIGAASYDHAFVGLAYLADDLKLSEEHLFIYRQRACIDPFAEIQCGSQIIGKAVFSLMIYIYEITPGFDGENLSTVLLPNVKKDNQLRECELYNLIPCSVYIDVNALRDPTIVDTRTHEPINLKEIATTADSTMSKWEIWNWGVQIVASYLYSQNIDSLSYTNVLEFCPQIHYEKDGMKHFVYIYAHPSGVDEIPPINKSLIEQLVDWKGYYVNISLSNMFGTDGWTFRTEILYRTAGLLHNRVELMPIEEAIERYGTI